MIATAVGSAERTDSGALEVHAWFYDLEAVVLFEYDESGATFARLGGQAEKSAS